MKPIMSTRFRIAVWAGRVGVVLLVFLLWYIAAKAKWIQPVVLPPPSKFIEGFPSVVTDGTTWSAVKMTIIEVLWGALIALGGGLLLGFLGGLWRTFRQLGEPALVWLQVVPNILLYPVVLLILGLGSESKIAFAGGCGMLPIAYASMRALGYVEPGMLKTARALGASRWETILKVSIPSARPAILAGVRIGIASVLILVLAGEVLASFGGLGYEITRSAQELDAVRVYGLIGITIGIVGVVQGTVSALAAFTDRQNRTSKRA